MRIACRAEARRYMNPLPTGLRGVAGSRKMARLMTNYADKRASPRIAAKIPVTARGRDAAHKPVEEQSETLLINEAGALIALGAEIPTQGRFEITNRNTGDTCEARVAWRSSSQINGRWSYGVALIDPPGNFWGMPGPA